MLGMSILTLMEYVDFVMMLIYIKFFESFEEEKKAINEMAGK